MGSAPSDSRADRADDVLALARLAAKPRAVRAILGWLTRRAGGVVVALIGTDGSVLATAPDGPASDHGHGDGHRHHHGPAAHGGAATERALAAAATAVVDLHRRGTPSAVLAGGETGAAGPLHLVALGLEGAPGEAPYLAVVGPTGTPRQLSVVLADAARTLALCWRLEQVELHRRRVELAEGHSREAVLHLLMVGSVPAAQRIAGALGSELPPLNRVYVIECPGSRRREIARCITRATRGRTWIVPCPVRPNHLIALVSTEADAESNHRPDPTRWPDATPPGDVTRPTDAPGGRGADGAGAAEPGAPDAPLDRLIIQHIPGCRVGVSAPVALRETPVGYEQAFHALAVARGAPEGCASFGRHTDVSALSTPEGRLWAAEFLAPCLRYEPPRRADPGPQELLGTLGSWLSFGGAASRHLKIHRNTLAARVRQLDELLGRDVSRRLADQSAAWLALQLHAGAHWQLPAGRPGPSTLDTVLTTPAAAVWAKAQLLPLEQSKVTAGPETVGAWLRADARLPATAASLGISLPGTRKRLARAEEALGRSLLRAPSAKYELWLAMRALRRV
ncbi:helix-turn-helix domain-containing protein [Streptomyces sp. SAJ15]|uniref:helix-turn-helix domain-containing protein n=1 Tax=Streptomyces sp. SAJ15 TaxID=2011095 RepID=UPI0011870496|nr:helix-turn-helix domain-containing protein [Streptomyces sp. SAJ15]TVL93868.1 hypothetical protein CD790_02210 [Streptomyces sp. SAJ15]